MRSSALAVPLLAFAACQGGGPGGAGIAPSFTRDVAPIDQREMRRLPSSRRDRTVPARDREAGLRSLEPDRGGGAGRRHATMAAGRQLARPTQERRNGRSPRANARRSSRGRMRAGGSTVPRAKPRGRGAGAREARRDAASTCACRPPTAPSAPTGATDDYRCFLLDPKLDRRRVRLRRPGSTREQPRVVHHVILFRVAPSQVAEAQGLDAASRGPGLELLRRHRPLARRDFGAGHAGRRRLGRGVGAGRRGRPAPRRDRRSARGAAAGS